MQHSTPCTCFAIRRLARQVTQVYDHQLSAVGLKTTQYSLLSHLRVLPGISMGALASRMGMDRSTLTRNLKPLVDAGWVATARGPDARSVSAELTASGQALLARARPVWRAAQQELSALLGSTRARSLHAVAEAASALLESHQPGSAPGNT